MKKILVISNMMFASINVFGMQDSAINASNQNEENPLMSAVVRNDISKVKRLVNNIWDNKGQTVKKLLLAYKNKEPWSRDTLQQYLDLQKQRVKGAINERDIEGKMPLGNAIWWNSLEVAKYLVDHGADVNETDVYGRNSLIIAKQTKNESIQKYLIDHGAYDYDLLKNMSFEEALKKGDSVAKLYILEGIDHKHEHEGDRLMMCRISKKIHPSLETKRSLLLIEAIQHSNKNIIEFLIKHGANVNWEGSYQARAYTVDSFGMRKHISYKKTPLLAAAQANNQDIVRYLLNNGAVVDNSRDKNGDTALLIAVKNSNEAIINDLIDHGADVNVKDKWGNTVLKKALKEHNDEFAKYLIDHGADVNKGLYLAIENNDEVIAKYSIDHGADINAKGREGNTPLFFALKKENKGIINCLLDRNANANEIFADGETPLAKAIGKENTDLVKRLIERGANVNQHYGSDSDTPLHDAVIFENLDIVRYLLEHGARANAENRKGDTPIDVAVELYGKDSPMVEMLYSYDPLAKAITENNLDLVKNLVDHDYSVNQVCGKENNTPLHYAVISKNKAIVKYLVKQGAYVNLKNAEGETPISLAEKLCGMDSPIVQILYSPGARRI